MNKVLQWVIIRVNKKPYLIKEYCDTMPLAVKFCEILNRHNPKEIYDYCHVNEPVFEKDVQKIKE